MKAYLIISNLSDDTRDVREYIDSYLKRLSSLAGMTFELGTLEQVIEQGVALYFVGTGGSEPSFKRDYTKTPGPYYLLTIPPFNSLPAALEISGYLKSINEKVEILHGADEVVASRLKNIFVCAKAKAILAKSKIGAIGDNIGLIASTANPAVTKKTLNMETVQISLDELVSEYHKGGYEANTFTEELKKHPFDKVELEKALNVYGASQRLIKKYALNGLTIKCFDLLSMIKTTGCLALAILNAQGIPAACEGDTKTLISMMVATAVTGQSSFMANPCSVDKDTDEMIFAHCTIPLDFIDTYNLVTHYESGIGVAVSADMAPRTVTVFKCDETMKTWYVDRAQLVETTHKADLCRTQMTIKLEHGSRYFLDNAVCNHHIIIPGDYYDALNAFMKEFN